MAIIDSGTIDDLPLGHHDLEDGICVNIMEIEMKDTGVFESHHKYVDIHYPITESEQIEIADEKASLITQNYNEEKDCVLGTAKGERYTIKMQHPFVVMPGEAHVPGLCDAEKKTIRKAVIKVFT